MSWVVLLCDRAESVIWSFDRAVDEGELGNVIFMNHIQYWSLLNFVNLWVLELALVDSSLLIVAIRRDELSGVMLWDSMQSVEGLW